MEKDLLSLLLPFPLKSHLDVSRESLDEMRRISIRCNLFPFLYSRLKTIETREGVHGDLTEFLSEQRGAFRKAVSWSMKKEETEKRVVNLLNSAGIAAVVIRGTALSRELFGDSSSRTPADVDILIPGDSLAGVDGILTAEGYQRGDALPLGFWKNRLHHAIYYFIPDNRVVEIHWNFSIPGFFRLEPEEIWQGVMQVDRELRLSPDMLLIMLLMHHHMHSFRELRILIDILWAVWTYRDDVAWDVFLKRLRRIGLVKTFSITILQMKRILSDEEYVITPFPVLEREIRMKRRMSVLCGVFGLYDFGERDDRGFMNKLVLRLALDRWSAIVYSAVKILFPSPAILSQLYQIRSGWLLPYYYCRFIGWRLSNRKGQS